MNAAFAPDPVFALIAEHQAAYAEWDRLSEVWSTMDPTAPGYAEAQTASDPSGRREAAAYDALFSGAPSTLSGALALAEYLGVAVCRVRIDAEPTDGELALRTVTEALSRLVLTATEKPTESTSGHPDAGLIALGLPFLAAWRDEAATGARATERPDDPEARRVFREAAERCGRLGDQIALQAAATVEGLGIKALALSRYTSEDASPADPLAEPREAPVGSDIAFLWQIQTGARRLLDEVAPAVLARPSGPDLPAMSIGELSDLHEACLQASQHLAALADRFGASEERRRARVVIDQEADRLGDLALACVDELHGRTPATEDERAERVAVLASNAARFHAWAELAALAISEASAGRRR